MRFDDSAACPPTAPAPTCGRAGRLLDPAALSPLALPGRTDFAPARTPTRRELLREAGLGWAGALAKPLMPAGALAALVAGNWPGRAAAAAVPTPRQTEGPFYPVDFPADVDGGLLRQGDVAYAQGQPVWVDGVVMDTGAQPLAGAMVEIWQCDADGHYRHPGDGNRADRRFQSYGRVQTDAQGRYRFRTIRPVAYTGRTPHIHVKVRRDGRELLTTQLYVHGDPGNERDVLWRRLGTAAAAVTVDFKPAADGHLQAHFPIVVRV